MLIWSGKIVHPPIIERETFHKVQAMIGGRATAPAGHKPHRRQHPYAPRGLAGTRQSRSCSLKQF
jgi:hypothetical protein